MKTSLLTRFLACLSFPLVSLVAIPAAIPGSESALWRSVALAQSKDFAIVDETVRTAFEPVSVTALVYDGSRLKQYDAEFSAVPTGNSGEKLYRVAAVLPFNSSSASGASSGKGQSPAANGLVVCFFLVSVDGDFASTNVQLWPLDRLEANSRTREELEKDFENAKKEIPKQQARNDALEQELERAKERASNLSEVEDIMGLKSTLEQLQNSDSSAANELELGRLRSLVQQSRALPIPPHVISNRLELSKQLQEIALATASAEHVRSNRKQNASASYFHKLDLAREAEGVDIRGMAAQVLDLRQKRKELEARLGVTAAQLAGENQGTVGTPPTTDGSGAEF